PGGGEGREYLSRNSNVVERDAFVDRMSSREITRTPDERRSSMQGGPHTRLAAGVEASPAVPWRPAGVRGVLAHGLSKQTKIIRGQGSMAQVLLDKLDADGRCVAAR